MDLKTIISKAVQLSIRDRKKLIDEVEKSLSDEEGDMELTAEQQQLIETRNAELLAHPEIALTREEFNARVRGGR
jgi:putative addiction module component (TIGR02574 family)